MVTYTLKRVSIAHLPTPLEPLARLSQRLGGPELWVKRDDQTGLATGGNKTRKLEFLLADALANGADTLLTCGAAQSNHARQTAAAAAKLGLKAVLVLRGEAPPGVQGNLLLDLLLGAEIVWAGDRPLPDALESAAAACHRRGDTPYVVPYGGSNPVGASGYVAAMEELLAQCAQQELHFDHIVFASSSGGTQAGLAVGARALGYTGRVLGISVDMPGASLRASVAELATATAVRLGLDLTFAAADIDVNDDYVGGGYAAISELEREAIRTVAQTEGLLLDPVYTGRAFGGLLDLIRCGAFAPDERVLFWHTGGSAGLFGYAEAVLGSAWAR
ncbi:MAG: D-cysteine desulfhydrase family protein [Anaerolineae bacterium]|nr:D-cysteine desulfhydrase family protein [Anaerolineae bacterium]